MHIYQPWLCPEFLIAPWEIGIGQNNPPKNPESDGDKMNPLPWTGRGWITSPVIRWVVPEGPVTAISSMDPNLSVCETLITAARRFGHVLGVFLGTIRKSTMAMEDTLFISILFMFFGFRG